MRQRLGVARCLLCDPELLILDEPVNGLDPAGILEFRGLVRSLVDEGRTVLLSSHLLDEVEKTCDLAAIVDNGRVVAQGTIAELTARRRAHDRHRRRADGEGRGRAGRRARRGARGRVRRRHPRDARARTRRATSTSSPSLLRRLLAEDISVERVTPVTRSLEDEFLSMTTRLENA